jgi:histidinol-phosphatase (PHP family)
VPSAPGDYHVHTRFSDGEGEPAECVARALALSLPEIGFADHLAPRCADPRDEYGIGADHLEEYVSAVREAAARYPQIVVLLGVEADYMPEAHDEIAGILAAHPFDFVIGAVHDVEGFSFDDPQGRDDARWCRGPGVYERYYELLGRAASSGLFDVLAHIDYIEVWGHPLPDGVAAAEDEALCAIAAAGTAIEVNTTGILDPAGRMYPALGLLEDARRLGIPLVFGSDAHAVDQVGWRFDEGVALARRAGYDSWLRLSTGLAEPLP